MALTARLDSPAALFRKLEREAYRAFHAPTPLQKSDHFYNFCVTASSMRDYCHEHMHRLTKLQRKSQESVWWKLPLLIATFEIANSTKHFVLRDTSTGVQRSIQTRAVGTKILGFVDVYRNTAGHFKAVPVQRPEVTVTLSDGKRFELHQFTCSVLAYWRTHLLSIGIKLRRQPFARLAGAA
jgi:hypothetical protein